MKWEEKGTGNKIKRRDGERKKRSMKGIERRTGKGVPCILVKFCRPLW